jgi:hypothetical protein
LTFNPASIALVRFPADCAEDPNPSAPFSDEDVFVMALVGAQTATGSPTRIIVSFSDFMPLGLISQIQLGDFGVLADQAGNSGEVISGQTGTLPGNNTFEWVQDTNRSQLDATPITAASINPVDVPGADGDTGEVMLYLEFEDRGIYDVQVTAPLASAPCPAS